MNFENVYAECFEYVYLYSCSLCKNEHIAQEITSDAFYKAMLSINNFRGECDIKVWLCQIAKNCYYTYLKKNKQKENSEEDEFQNVADSKSSIEERLIDEDETMKIKMALYNLAQPYREVFMWRVFAQLSFKQIGEIFGKTDNWACVTYHRAKLAIKESLEETENEE